jgi:hypothetical protein
MPAVKIKAAGRIRIASLSLRGGKKRRRAEVLWSWNEWMGGFAAGLDG